MRLRTLATCILAMLMLPCALLAADSGINVMDFGAKADGVTDNTAAFQKALDTAGVKGEPVTVPAGEYLIAGTLSVPESVTLQGSWQAPHFPKRKGTLIYATADAGNEDGTPFIRLHADSCVRGMTIFYPDQDFPKVKPYPWTIQGEGTHCSVIDMTLVNPYKGVDFGTKPNEMHLIRNLYGTPLKIGIYLDKCTDIGRVENVHFTSNSYGAFDHPKAPTGEKINQMVKYMTENLTGFLIGRVDWECMNGCFVIFPKIGYHFVRSITENTNSVWPVHPGAGNALITNSGADVSSCALMIDRSQTHAGATFVNCQFFGKVVIGPNNGGPVRFTSSTFFGAIQTDKQGNPTNMDIQGVGSVTVDNCYFLTLNDWNTNPINVRASGGSLTIVNSEFREMDRTYIDLEPGLKSAIITGNTFRGTPGVVNKSRAKVQIASNIEIPEISEKGAIIVDDWDKKHGFTCEGAWVEVHAGQDYMNKCHWTHEADGTAKASWRPTLPAAGRYAVFIWNAGDSLGAYTAGVRYTIHSKTGDRTIVPALEGRIGRWIRLGDFDFDKGTSGYVSATNEPTNTKGFVYIDAVKFVQTK